MNPDKSIDHQLKEHFHDALKMFVVASLGIFLLLLIYDGTVFLYINRRMAWLMLPSALVLFVLAEAFRRRPEKGHCHSGCHCGGGSHRFSWTTLLLVALPFMLGILVPPRPLGALTMGNREVTSSIASASNSGSQVTMTQEGDSSILDWILAFQRSSDLATFLNQEAHVTGFVFRDETFQSDEFMVSRFIITCCVADAVAAGLPVRWMDAEVLELDQWVDVKGHFVLESVDGQEVPVIVADDVVLIEPLDQPYLYP